MNPARRVGPGPRAAASRTSQVAGMGAHDTELSIHRDDGIVLRTQKLGEADRIVTILACKSGRVRAVPQGVRKTRSRFARLEPSRTWTCCCAPARRAGLGGHRLPA